jgi:catechol 2,3-dioxygenase-like lactoylglutathione lyase family enzyme
MCYIIRDTTHTVREQLFLIETLVGFVPILSWKWQGATAACEEGAMVKYVCALIAVEDVAVSRSFYEECLGQKVKDDFVENVAFEGGFAIHRRGHFQDLLGGGERYAAVPKSHTGELYFESDDVEAFEQRLKQAGVEFIHSIREQPWGQQVMRVYDPDGHVVEIGEPMESVVLRLYRQGFSLESICQKTSMPGPFVQGVIGAAV